jgi:hypothetical protein
MRGLVDSLSPIIDRYGRILAHEARNIPPSQRRSTRQRGEKGKLVTFNWADDSRKVDLEYERSLRAGGSPSLAKYRSSAKPTTIQ